MPLAEGSSFQANMESEHFSKDTYTRFDVTSMSETHFQREKQTFRIARNSRTMWNNLKKPKAVTKKKSFRECTNTHGYKRADYIIIIENKHG